MPELVVEDNFIMLIIRRKKRGKIDFFSQDQFKRRIIVEFCIYKIAIM